MDTYSNIVVSIAGRVATVLLNRPELHNALNPEMITDITSAVTTLDAYASISAIIFKGSGKSFCAGADMNYMASMAQFSEPENVQDAERLHDMFETIARCSKVTIAAVHGAAIGGGAGFVAACDIALSESSAVFAFSEVRLGLAPAVIAPFVLSKIPIGSARALFLTGERFSAETAQRIGLVYKLADQDLERELIDLISNLNLGSTKAQSEIKALMSSIERSSLSEAKPITTSTIARLRASVDGQEGLKAFLEKRKPNWIEPGQ